MRTLTVFYLVLVLVPLAVVLMGRVPPAQAGFWWAAYMAAGLAGLSMLGRCTSTGSDRPFSFHPAPGRTGGQLEFTMKELGDFTRIHSERFDLF